MALVKPTKKKKKTANDDEDDEDYNAADSSGFRALGLNEQLLRGVAQQGYKKPTPIQRKTIPMLLQGRDVVAMARTGSGKTAAFLLAAMQTLLTQPPREGHEDGQPRVLIVAPTRELAVQIQKERSDFQLESSMLLVTVSSRRSTTS